MGRGYLPPCTMYGQHPKNYNYKSYSDTSAATNSSWGVNAPFESSGAFWDVGHSIWMVNVIYPILMKLLAR